MERYDVMLDKFHVAALSCGDEVIVKPQSSESGDEVIVKPQSSESVMCY